MGSLLPRPCGEDGGLLDRPEVQQLTAGSRGSGIVRYGLPT